MAACGTDSGYAAGCRCVDCKAARAAAERERLKRRRAGTARASGRQSRGVRPENELLWPSRLAVTCWCERSIVLVPTQEIRDGLTRACPQCGDPSDRSQPEGESTR